MFNDKNLDVIRIYLEKRCGLYLPGEKDHFLTNRVKKRMKANATDSLHDYFTRVLTGNDAELHKLIDLLAVNETFFFRYREQFDIAERLVRRQIMNKPFRPIKLWCAACANGAEPYSLAIKLLSVIAETGATVDILASDIDTEALDEAQAGVFSERCMNEEMPAPYRDHYFTPGNNGSYHLVDRIKKMVRFQRCNLKTDDYPDDIDIIFCRNVLIYFRETVKTEILFRMHDSLRPDGHLFLAPTEILTDMGDFFESRTDDNGHRYFRKNMTCRVSVRTEPEPVQAVNNHPVIMSPAAPVVTKAIPRPVIRIPSAPESGSTGLQSSHNVLCITDIHSKEDCLHYESLLRETLNTDRRGSITLDLTGARYILGSFFGILKRFVLTCAADEIPVTILCDEKNQRWLEKHNIPANLLVMAGKS